MQKASAPYASLRERLLAELLAQYVEASAAGNEQGAHVMHQHLNKFALSLNAAEMQRQGLLAENTALREALRVRGL